MSAEVLEKPLSTQPKIAEPCKKENIINRLALNEPHRTIANDYNISRQRVTQLNKEFKHEIQERSQKFIQQNIQPILEAASKDINVNLKISELFESDIDSITSERVQFKTHVQRNISNLLLARADIGIFPTHTNLMANNITINQTQINPSVTKLVGQALIDRLRTREYEVEGEEIPQNNENQQS